MLATQVSGNGDLRIEVVLCSDGVEVALRSELDIAPGSDSVIVHPRLSPRDRSIISDRPTTGNFHEVNANGLRCHRPQAKYCRSYRIDVQADRISTQLVTRCCS